jgi:hypothetical protein
MAADGDFLNFEITWEDVERVFSHLSGDPTVSSEVSTLFVEHQALTNKLS